MTSFSSKNVEDLNGNDRNGRYDNPAFQEDALDSERYTEHNTKIDDSQYEAIDLRRRSRESTVIDVPEIQTPKTLNVGDDLEIQESNFVRAVIGPIHEVGEFFSRNAGIFEMLFIYLLILFYIGYMIAALILNYNEAIPLLVIFILVLIFQIYAFVRDHWGDEIWEVWKPAYFAISGNMYWIKWVCIIIILALFVIFIALDVSKRPEQLISLAGYVIFLFLLWILGSKYPAKVRWRPVFWGLGIQIFLAGLILRVESVFEFFDWLGNFAQTFLDYVTDGSIFLFGEKYYEHFFAFKVLPIIIYFSAFISVMYYLGAMQWLIFKIAWLMQFTLGTSGTESMCAAGNIFVGQTESPLLIRPYIKDVTTSELFAIMTAGFGTIAGSVLGAYLGFGIKPVYVITACVMAAPCALALAKLMYPETKVSKFRSLDGLALDPPNQRNIIEAAFVGASDALPLVLNIAANLIAFISLLAALNGFLGWYGSLVGFDNLSFETICSYVFMPVTFLMGIEWADCFKCAELLGTKIFLNEFIAYEELAKLIANKDSGTIPREDENGTVLWISEKSEAIITYALCGFANVGSLGIMLGGLGTMCPERQPEMAKIVIRALIAGIFVSIMNASISGFFYLPTPDCVQIFNFTSWDGTTEKGEVYSCCLNNNIITANQQRCCDYDWSADELKSLEYCNATRYLLE